MSGYDLVTDSPTKRIYEAVKRIPKGHVATYGKSAEMAGDHRMARAVGNALHKNPDPEHIPCFRVVNAKGELAGAFAFSGEDVQAELLRADGVEVINGRVDLEKYGCVLPIMPVNGKHYIGIDIKNVDKLEALLSENAKMPKEASLLGEIAANGREFVLENYTPRKVAERLLDMIRIR